MPAKGLDLSVALFLVCSLVAIFLLVARRIFLKGELGGGSCGRNFAAVVLVCLWVLYVTVCSLTQYGILEF